jgi:hypothetical protein
MFIYCFLKKYIFSLLLSRAPTSSSCSVTLKFAIWASSLYKIISLIRLSKRGRSRIFSESDLPEESSQLSNVKRSFIGFFLPGKKQMFVTVKKTKNPYRLTGKGLCKLTKSPLNSYCIITFVFQLFSADCTSSV